MRNVVIYALSSVTAGTDGTYTTLKAATDAINSGVITGVCNDCHHKQYQRNCYSFLKCKRYRFGKLQFSFTHATGSGYSVSGNIDNPLIILNGADNVIIDGRATGTTGDLIFVIKYRCSGIIE